MNEYKKEIPGISPASLKMDMAMFKDDILRDIRSTKLSLDANYIKSEEYLKEKITQFEIKINSFGQKISELSNLIITDNAIREKVESLNEFKEEIKDIIFKRRAKYNEFETQINNDISRINNILSESVIYPALIGKSAKFKNFHEFMDYILQEITTLVLFKDKSGLDLAPFKKKIDITLDAFKIQMNNFSSKDYTNDLIKRTEDRIKSLLRIYDDRLQDTRIENSHYSYGLKKKTEEMGKQMEIIKELQNNLNEKIENLKGNDFLKVNNNEINYLKNKLNKLNEIIKELVTYHPSTQKNYINEIEKKSSKIYSGVKQYIKGNLNANELSSMKNFSYKRSKTKVFDQSPSPPMTSPFTFPEKNNINECTNKKSSTNELFRNKYSNNNITNIFDKKNSFNLKSELNEQFEFSHNLKNDNNKSSKKNLILRRNTFNYNLDKINSTESTLNNERLNNYNSDKKESKIEDKIIIEEEEPNKINLSRNLSNNNLDNSLLSIKEENFNEHSDINQKVVTQDNNNEKKVKNKSNQFIIREEYENILSDNSYKNIETTIPEIIKKQKKTIIIAEEILNNKEKNDSNSILKVNNEKEKFNIINSENNKKQLLLNSNNLEKNIKIFSDKKKENKDKYNKLIKKNNDKLIKIFDESKTIKNSNKSNNINITNIYNETNHKAHSVQSNYEKLNNSFKKNNNTHDPLKKPINKTIISKGNNPKNSQIQNNNNLENKQNIRNNYPINSNLKPNNNKKGETISINKTYYSSFPKINKELTGNKLMQNNNCLDLNNIFGKTLNAAKFWNNQENMTISPYAKKPKKILLTNPDNIPPNNISLIWKKIKNFNNKNISNLSQSDKNMEIKKIEQLYNTVNNNYYLSNRLNKNDDEKFQLSKKKINKNP